MKNINLKLKSPFLKNFLIWFCLCGSGIEANVINQISNGGLMPHVPFSLITAPSYNYFLERLAWAFAAPSHFFGDWLPGFGKIWSPGDLLFVISWLFVIICLARVLFKYVKKFSKK
jgi:hypothetical protein